jgi:hypothetical protein
VKIFARCKRSSTPMGSPSLTPGPGSSGSETAIFGMLTYKALLKFQKKQRASSDRLPRAANADSAEAGRD